MMSKIRSIQDSWLAKGILILTALSFMSLFGVSGYLSGAASDRPVIRVDDIVIGQDEINAQFNQEIQMAKNLFGDSLDVNDNMRNAVMLGIVQKDLVNAIMKKTAADNNISISNELVRKIIYSQAEFMDAEGKFSLEKLRRLLNASGWNEQRYINSLREDIVKQHLVQMPVEGIRVPQFMLPYLAQLENQKKVFEYIEIIPEKLKTDRKISQEELEQYYNDFAAQFEAPEKRDISFIELPLAKLAAKIQPNEDEIKAYYNENISHYVEPENREVLQMMFNEQADADRAYAALNAGGDFYKVAQDIAGQDKASTELGKVSKDMLVADLSDAVFGLKKGGITQPIKSELGWHIIKVIKITPKKETTLAQARTKIVEEIRKEKAYDEAYNTVAEIEDKIGGGANLDEIAAEYKVAIHEVKGLDENGRAAQQPKGYQNLLASSDFIDTAFSYNSGETSQVIENDDGFVIVRVDHIKDAHLLDMDQVKNQIEKLWATNEKNAIAQEIINDVTHDLENGDKPADVARRFGLKMHQTKALSRNDHLDGLNPMQMNEIFQESLGQPKLIAQEDKSLIIVPVKVIQSNSLPGKEEAEVLRAKAASDLSQTAANALIDAYGTNYKIRVKYKYVGLAD